MAVPTIKHGPVELACEGCELYAGASAYVTSAVVSYHPEGGGIEQMAAHLVRHGAVTGLALNPAARD